MPFCLNVSVAELSAAIPVDYDAQESRTKLVKLIQLWNLLRTLLLHCNALSTNRALRDLIRNSAIQLNIAWEQYLGTC